MSWRGKGRRRASLAGLFADILDATHDYADDWIDRFDDFEYHMRDAFDDVVEDRDYWNDGPSYGRDDRDRCEGPYRRPLSVGREAGVDKDSIKQILDEAGLTELSERVAQLSQTVEQLAKA